MAAPAITVYSAAPTTQVRNTFIDLPSTPLATPVPSPLATAPARGSVSMKDTLSEASEEKQLTVSGFMARTKPSPLGMLGAIVEGEFQTQPLQVSRLPSDQFVVVGGASSIPPTPAASWGYLPTPTGTPYAMTKTTLSLVDMIQSPKGPLVTSYQGYSMPYPQVVHSYPMQPAPMQVPHAAPVYHIPPPLAAPPAPGVVGPPGSVAPSQPPTLPPAGPPSGGPGPVIHSYPVQPAPVHLPPPIHAPQMAPVYHIPPPLAAPPAPGIVGRPPAAAPSQPPTQAPGGPPVIPPAAPPTAPPAGAPEVYRAPAAPASQPGTACAAMQLGLISPPPSQAPQVIMTTGPVQATNPQVMQQRFPPPPPSAPAPHYYMQSPAGAPQRPPLALDAAATPEKDLKMLWEVAVASHNQQAMEAVIRQAWQAGMSIEQLKQ